MNIIFTIVLILLTSNFCYSQAGTAIYKMELETLGSKEGNARLKKEDPRQYALLKKMDDGAKKAAEQLEYELVFAGNRSRFEMREVMSVGNNDPYIRVANVASEGVFYNDLQDQERLMQRKEFGQELLVRLEPVEWEITGETEIKRGFTCRKALTEKISHGRNGIIRKPVEAWFTTEIPLNFGPVGYAGLPGFIIELRMDNRRFYLKELQEKENISIERPTGKEVTPEELSDMFRKAMGNIRPE